VLAGAYRCLEMFRMQEYRRGDQHRVHIGRQQFLIICKHAGIGSVQPPLRRFRFLWNKVADRCKACRCMLDEVTGVEKSTSAGAYQADGHSGVRGGRTHGLCGYEHCRLEYVPPRRSRVVGVWFHRLPH
jgi:hypothetical protein